MNIVGINAYHGDVSAVLVRDGQLVAAVEEERFRRIKHYAGFPEQALRACIDLGGIEPREVDLFAVSRDPRAHLLRKAWFVLRHRPRGTIAARARNLASVRGVSSRIADALGLERRATRARTRFVEHHPSHLASAAFVSPFETGAVCAIDGFGDFVSTSWGRLDGSRISVDGRVFFPHSLGLLYLAVTQFLGFPKYGDEFKVMGLAPYGDPSYVRKLETLVRLQDGGHFELDLSYFRHVTDGVQMTWNDGEPTIGPVYSAKLATLLGPARGPDEALEPRHEAIAASLQVVFERAAFHVLRHVRKNTGRTRLCLAGGCAMNSVANGKIREQTGFREVFIQPAAGDNGTALGAAFHAWHASGNRPRGFVMQHSLWGPSFDNSAIVTALDAQRSMIAERDFTRRAGVGDPGARFPPPRMEGSVGARRVDGGADRRRPRRRLVPGPHGVGRARPRQPQHRRRPAARRHARDHQHADQVSRALPSLRGGGAGGGARRFLRRGGPRPVHAAGLSGPARQAQDGAGDPPRRRSGPAAARQRKIEPPLLRP